MTTCHTAAICTKEGVDPGEGGIDAPLTQKSQRPTRSSKPAAASALKLGFTWVPAQIRSVLRVIPRARFGCRNRPGFPAAPSLHDPVLKILANIAITVQNNDRDDPMKILLIEDDIETARYILRCLDEGGHHPTLAADGREGLGRAMAESWDLLIVDRMLPHLDGLTLVQAVRQSGNATAVLFLTTLGSVDDRVQGLNAGADDYLIKPFAFSELLARVAALGRRSHRAGVETTLHFADLEVDLLARRVLRSGVPIDLLPREFRLLEYLMKHAEQVVTRAMLLENVWDIHFDPNTSVVETHISRLRSKIDRSNSVPLIHTVRGSGYTFRAPK